MHALPESYYLTLPAGPPSQGDIWINLPLPYRDPPYGLGVLITPSCDFEHDKAPLVNYLVLMEVQEYLQTVGGFNLLEEELRRIEDGLRNVSVHPRSPEVLARARVGQPAKLPAAPAPE